MSGSCLRGRARLWPRIVSAIALLAAVSGAPAFADTLTVVIDEAKLLKLPKDAATLVIGNPLIADASLQSGGLIVVTGKAYGMTNLLALDHNGNIVMRKALRVQGPRDTVVLYRGVERETYSCTPNCEPRVTLGDSSQSFSKDMAQTTLRNSQAKAAAQP